MMKLKKNELKLYIFNFKNKIYFQFFSVYTVYTYSNICFSICSFALKRSRGGDFVLCGYFSHKLDAYIHMELKTKKFYLQNSGHGSASKLVKRGRPFIVPQFTFTFIVPCPEVITTPAGGVHV